MAPRTADAGMLVPMTSPGPPQVAVMGAGAVGGYFGGMLALSGVPVTLIGRPQHVDAIRRDGLVIERADRRDVVRVEAATDAAAVGNVDVVLVCVKSPDTRDAAVAMKPHLRGDAVVVSLQNGVGNADAIAEVLDQVVLAAVVWVGAYMEGPGVVRHTGRGELDLGVTRAGANRPRARERARDVAAMFERAGVRCAVSDKVEAELWQKLAINCAFNAISALGHARYRRMTAEPTIHHLMETAVRETLAVARATGIELDEPGMLATVWRIAASMPEQYSSTAQDILRGKPTEIDMLNGYVAQRGQELGIATPVNRALHALVKLREAGDDFA
jgi:2-dehydropantoate 2-reductase